ncbi:NAD(+) synthase [Microbacterium profundi]|uniref:NAD(+) synthase n=1 Tax=Microbacterium profundi TaxID=450380 RepID=UPI001F014E59|nr:NAD(+) synthase [Microbacterium profundi]MCE7481981.1 NAD(+) synthase [Microbacterium profundi]
MPTNEQLESMMIDLAELEAGVHLADPDKTAAQLVEEIRDTARRFRRVGAVIALSGGIDSSTSVGLAVRALGADRVRAISLPDKESSGKTVGYAQEVADAFGVQLEVRDITAPLAALGAYDDRLAVVRKHVPGFEDEHGDRFSVEFDAAQGEAGRLQRFTLKVERADGAQSFRLGGRDFLTIMAATNQKQRVRMLSTYRIADEANLLVIGTSNRPEIEQGFFVKHGDGCGDVFPLRHLLKSQVYDVAKAVGVPQSVIDRAPTTDTFSAEQTQEQYFYGTSVEAGDRLWLGWHRGDDIASVAADTRLSQSDVQKYYDLYSRRAEYAAYLTTTITS